MVASLVFTTGGTASPFIGLWPLVAIFAGFFGLAVTGAMGLLIVAQAILTYTQEGSSGLSILAFLSSGLIPLILSLVLWIRRSDKKEERTTKHLASRLSSAEGKSDIVINSIDDGVMAIDDDGVIDLINPSAQTLVGWDQGDAVGLDWRSVLRLLAQDGREVPEIDNPVAQALANNQTTHNDKLFIETAAGKKRLISIVSSPVSVDRKGIIIVFRDITKEKAEEREQAEFISTASHEMRTPVAAIEGYLGLALNPATATIDEKARDYITKAHASAQHLGELFQNLLDISKAEDGRLKSEPEVIDVSATVGDIFESLSPLAHEKKLRFTYRPNPTVKEDSTEKRLQPVYYSSVDTSHFREVVSNLITNAIKYTPEGDVIVDVNGDEKLVTISVQDTGIGIPSEDIPHLFQKFYRVDNTDTREIGGTGLGLYLCRRLAEAMGGHLRVESKYGEGSTFLLDVPRLGHEEATKKLQELELAEAANAKKPKSTEDTVTEVKPAELAEPIQIIKSDKPRLDTPTNEGQAIDMFDAPQNNSPASPADGGIETPHEYRLSSKTGPINPLEKVPNYSPVNLPSAPAVNQANTAISAANPPALSTTSVNPPEAQPQATSPIAYTAPPNYSNYSPFPRRPVSPSGTLAEIEATAKTNSHPSQHQTIPSAIPTPTSHPNPPAPALTLVANQPILAAQGHPAPQMPTRHSPSTVPPRPDARPISIPSAER